ncbi:efflux RND transporter periplasmic adaptor subunit [Stutzerimonas azotifigens]|uniref:efflux RND transporter periplasmic adaptor subunit n=1 Tax=Stutzerimonas azotifigens TaxID=291995 RepID=UPI000414D674|nr:efflux RND transporter periplasmic adaptor subunit [Stutzerimonas azotifigens]
MFRPLLPLAGLFACALTLAACTAEEPAAPQPRPVMVVHPQPASEAMVSYAGEVRARYEPELAFRIGGKIVERLVEVGEHVRENQPLARLDPQDVRLQLDGVQAQVAAAEANLRVARAERERYRTLLDRQLASRSQYDSADNQYRAAEARLKQARAELDVARNQVDYAVLRANRDGVIVQRLAEVGQVVAAGQSVFVLAADGEREVVIALPEHSVDLYRLGQAVSVELWSRPGQRYAGSIRELSPAADARTRTYQARVAFTEQAPADLGQSARVFAAHDGEVALSVPLSALSADGDRTFVWRVKDDGTLEQATVRTGPYGEQRVPVLEGLAPQDWVVLAGVHMLHEGQAVRPVDRDNRPVAVGAVEARP